jgi:hypothetical protein
MSPIKERRVSLYLEIVGGVAVLLGLIFVGLELRQNTAAMQAATFQDLAHTTSEFLVDISLNPDARRVWLTGWQDPQGLSEDDKVTFQLLQSSFWIRMQNAYMQWQRGTLTDRDWLVYHNVACGAARTPGGVAHWPRDFSLSEDFKEFLDACDE